MSQAKDISDRSRIRCHKADMAVAAVEPDGEKVPGRAALLSGIHSHREQAAEEGSQGLIQDLPDHFQGLSSHRAEEMSHRNCQVHQGADLQVFRTVCHCSPADCSQSVCNCSHIHSHCRSHQKGRATAESRYNYSCFQLLSAIFYVEIQLLTKSLPAVIFSFRNKGVFVRKYALFL